MRFLPFLILVLFGTFCQQLYSQTYEELDPRIQQHYTEAEYYVLKASDPDSVEIIKFYFTQSFSLVNHTCTNCISVDIHSIDITKYEHFRLPGRRMEIGLTRSYDMLQLLTTIELHQQYTSIRNNH